MKPPSSTPRGDRSRVEWLPDSAYVVLGLLSFDRALTGYELKQWARGSIRFFWTEPAMSQIYGELSRLESLGLVEAADESGGGDRPRTAYRLTPRGRDELARWVEHSPVPAPVLRHGAAFRLFLGHLASPDRVLDLLDEHERVLEDLLAGLRATRRELEDDPEPERWRYPMAVAAWGERLYRGDRVGARAARDRLAATASDAGSVE